MKQKLCWKITLNAIWVYNYKIPSQVTPKVDRIKILSMQVLNQHKDEFTTDFAKNKQILEKFAIVRSKGLKNEMAGYITKHVKRDLDSKAQKLQKEERRARQEESEEQVEGQMDDSDVEQIDVESSDDSQEQTQDAESEEIVMENQRE
jgi:small subunit ribosomal protein S17e